MTTTTSRRSLLRNSAATVAAVGLGGKLVRAQEPPIRIGVIYDLSGPFAAAGSVPCAIGAQIAIDIVNERGGVAGKYKVQPINADSQSKADAAINEAERLLNVEKVDILAGVYASAHAVPLAEKVDKQKKLLWITTAIADAVVKDRNLQYTFRPQPNGGLFGAYSVQEVEPPVTSHQLVHRQVVVDAARRPRGTARSSPSRSPSAPGRSRNG